MSSSENSNHLLINKKKKLTWTYEEDELLINWICTNGARNWSACSKVIKNRTNKQIRERWLHSLNPIIKKGFWTNAEDYIIYKLYKKLNSQWSKYQKHLPGRTQISIKNRFFCTLRTKAIEKNVLYSYKTIQQMRMSELLKYYDEVYKEKTSLIDLKLEEYYRSSGRRSTENEILSIFEIEKAIKADEKYNENTDLTTEMNNSSSDLFYSRQRLRSSVESSFLNDESFINKNQTMLNMKRLINLSKSSSNKLNLTSSSMKTESKRYFSVNKAPKQSLFERKFLEEMENEKKTRRKEEEEIINNEQENKTLYLLSRLGNMNEYDTMYNTNTIGNSSKVSNSDLFDLLLFQLKENETSNEKHLINDLNELEDILNTNSSSLRVSCFGSHISPSVYDSL